MRLILTISLFFFLTSCWPTSVSFVDGSMPAEWKTFFVTSFENNAANMQIQQDRYKRLDTLCENSRQEAMDYAEEMQANTSGASAAKRKPNSYGAFPRTA